MTITISRLPERPAVFRVTFSNTIEAVDVRSAQLPQVIAHHFALPEHDATACPICRYRAEGIDRSRRVYTQEATR